MLKILVGINGMVMAWFKFAHVNNRVNHHAGQVQAPSAHRGTVTRTPLLCFFMPAYITA